MYSPSTRPRPSPATQARPPTVLPASVAGQPVADRIQTAGRSVPYLHSNTHRTIPAITVIIDGIRHYGIIIIRKDMISPCPCHPRVTTGQPASAPPACPSSSSCLQRFTGAVVVTDVGKRPAAKGKSGTRVRAPVVASMVYAETLLPAL